MLLRLLLWGSRKMLEFEKIGEVRFGRVHETMYWYDLRRMN